MDSATVLGFVRHLLTFGGGFLVTKGIMDAGVLNEAIGAVITLAGIVWSAFDKKNTAAILSAVNDSNNTAAK